MSACPSVATVSVVLSRFVKRLVAIVPLQTNAMSKASVSALQTAAGAIAA